MPRAQVTRRPYSPLLGHVWRPRHHRVTRTPGDECHDLMAPARQGLFVREPPPRRLERDGPQWSTTHSARGPNPSAPAPPARVPRPRRARLPPSGPEPGHCAGPRTSPGLDQHHRVAGRHRREGEADMIDRSGRPHRPSAPATSLDGAPGPVPPSPGPAGAPGSGHRAGPRPRAPRRPGRRGHWAARRTSRCGYGSRPPAVVIARELGGWCWSLAVMARPGPETASS